MTHHHEYWPVWLFYMPVWFEYFLRSCKLGDFRYPLLVNPAIAMSGFVGEKKSEILRLLPPSIYPSTSFVNPKTDAAPALEPERRYVAKPDQGERGLGVKLIRSQADLNTYHAQAPRDYLVQEYVDYPVEAGVFFVRAPSFSQPRITSIVLKKRAQIVGDGMRTVEELVKAEKRYERQVRRLKMVYPLLRWDVIPGHGEAVVLDEIRNHRRGAEFVDGRHLMGEGLESVFKELFPEDKGFHYGRVDLKCASEDDLRQGKNFQILEVNGVTSEPGEIYDPDMTLKEAWQILRRHWKWIGEIAMVQKRQGSSSPSWRDVIAFLNEARTRPAFFDR